MAEQTKSCLNVYREDRNRVEEDARIEINQAEGGYGRKQVFELVQNAADALKGTPGRVHVVLTNECLYVANAGQPFSRQGVESILASHLSRKSGEQIGQFGLGFKSVTAVSDRPLVVSRSGSFQFDRAWARQLIQSLGITDAPNYPVLRLAKPVDPAELSRDDSTLQSLMTWATTVIKLPLKAHRKLLAEDVASFPAEFVLFSPDVTELILEDRDSRAIRTIRIEPAGDEYALRDGDSTTRWLVTKQVHRPSKEALRDAGQLVRRENVELSWAIRTSGGRALGEFWAYFPTSIRSTLSGIVNAPWKLSADRLSILEGPFNEELLTEVLPRAVCAAIPRLQRPFDPGAVLDFLPARGDEARSWADRVLNEPLISAVAKVPSLPALDGSLRSPSVLSLHPKTLSDAWKEAWSVPDTEASKWVHHSVDRTAERRLKAERLAQAGGAGRPSLKSWIEAMVSDQSPEQSASAIRLVARICTDMPQLAAEARSARVMLLEDGVLSPVVKGSVFVRGDGQSSDHNFLDSRLASDPSLQEALAALGIEVLNPGGELRALLHQGQLDPQGWKSVWELSRQLDSEVAASIFREELPAPLVFTVRVRVHSGKWVPIAETFLGGEVIPSSGTRDADFLISPAFHSADIDLLQRLGAVSVPRLIAGAPEEPWLRDYKEVWAKRYAQTVTSKGTKLGLDKIEISGPDVPWPLDCMSRLSLAARAAISEAILRTQANQRWTVRHRTNSQLPPKHVVGPAVYRLKQYGVLPTTVGPCTIELCLHPLSEMPRILPVAEVSEQWADALNLPKDCGGWSPEDWQAVLADAERKRQQDTPRLYVLAARAGIATPPTIVVTQPGGQAVRRSPREVAATSDNNVQESLSLASIPAILVPSDEDVAILRDLWGLADGRDMLKEEIVAVPDSEPALLIDRYPPLKIFYDDVPELELLEVQTCSSLEVLVSTPKGQESRPRPYHRQGNVVRVLNGTDQQILTRLGTALGIQINADNVLDQLKERERNALRAAIRVEPDLAKKLVIAVGADSLRRHLPRTALDDLEEQTGRSLTDREVARLALSVHGFAVLGELRQELQERGLEPPVQWAGRSEARRFVESLGFEREFAGFPGANLAPYLEVDGPVQLGELHDYQRIVVDRIQKLLLQDTGRKRGLVALPTGAGKTRVAVEAVIRLVARRAFEGTIVWIGQTEELCEQAVQTWAYVWRAIGPSEPLVLSRLWSSNDVTEAPGDIQVVVATIDKLAGIQGQDRYAWLQSPALIIVDEAHSSVAPTYSNVFRWLGREGQVTRITTPLIGLTATPYRGVNETETERLITRYDANRLDEGAFGEEDAYTYLQAERVLARVRQQVLAGIQIDLTTEQMRYIETFRALPQPLEERIGQNQERNAAIVDSVLHQPDDWAILLFASSVENARVLAAELSFHGVPARPISGNTDPAFRRRYVEQFRDGEIRVLTNYNVLTQGFDAPKVRAVYVARPTFSTNLYQQMIGRGLRGPKNGGSDEVLIVNVQDNLAMYGDQLAFNHFDYLWNRPHA